MEIIYTAEFVSALLGVLAGAFMTSMNRRSERKRNAENLFAEFVAAEMSRIRHCAGPFLRRNLAGDSPASFERLHRDGSENVADVSRLINFWERVESFLKFNSIDEALTKALLRHHFESHMSEFLNAFCAVSEKTDKGPYLQWTRAIRDLESRWLKDPASLNPQPSMH